MVHLQDQLAGILLVQLFLQLGTAVQVPFLNSHTEGYKFDPLL